MPRADSADRPQQSGMSDGDSSRTKTSFKYKFRYDPMYVRRQLSVDSALHRTSLALSRPVVFESFRADSTESRERSNSSVTLLASPAKVRNSRATRNSLWPATKYVS